VTTLPPDPDPLYVEEDRLWDPRNRVFVPRRPTLIPLVLAALAGAVMASLVWAALAHAGPIGPPPPEPSFAPVPTMEVRTVPSAPAVLATPRPSANPRLTMPKLAVPVARGHVRTGTATWYADPRKSGLYAAAGPPLRVGDWRGRLVTVTANGHSFRVVLSDWCACRDRVIDLSPGAFSRLAPLSRGLVRVTVTW
jgi:hypothetical protein